VSQLCLQALGSPFYRLLRLADYAGGIPNLPPHAQQNKDITAQFGGEMFRIKIFSSHKLFQTLIKAGNSHNLSQNFTEESVEFDANNRNVCRE
jgi:hypothetical protein